MMSQRQQLNVDCVCAASIINQQLTCRLMFQMFSSLQKSEQNEPTKANNVNSGAQSSLSQRAIREPLLFGAETRVLFHDEEAARTPAGCCCFAPLPLGWCVIEGTELVAWLAVSGEHKQNLLIYSSATINQPTNQQRNSLEFWARSVSAELQSSKRLCAELLIQLTRNSELEIQNSQLATRNSQLVGRVHHSSSMLLSGLFRLTQLTHFSHSSLHHMKHSFGRENSRGQFDGSSSSVSL